MRAAWIGWMSLCVACDPTLGDGSGIVEDDEIPQPGWEAELIGTSHDVSGTAVVIDDHTIELRDFTFDGGGLNARMYVLADGAPFSEAIETDSGNLVGTPFAGETLTLRLPSDSSPEGWNAISFWCVPARVGFGHGVFEPPPAR